MTRATEMSVLTEVIDRSSSAPSYIKGQRLRVCPTLAQRWPNGPTRKRADFELVTVGNIGCEESGQPGRDAAMQITRGHDLRRMVSICICGLNTKLAPSTIKFELLNSGCPKFQLSDSHCPARKYLIPETSSPVPAINYPSNLVTWSTSRLHIYLLDATHRENDSVGDIRYRQNA